MSTRPNAERFFVTAECRTNVFPKIVLLPGKLLFLDQISFASVHKAVATEIYFKYTQEAVTSHVYETVMHRIEEYYLLLL